MADAKVRVVARFRPLSKLELSKGGGRCCVGALSDSGVTLTTQDGAAFPFTFDRVFGTASGQAEVYEYAAAPVLSSLFAGFNGCLLAYGQTGSGKTHTMMGPPVVDTEAGGQQQPAAGAAPPPSAGIIPRVVHALFDRVHAALEADDGLEFEILVS